MRLLVFSDIHGDTRALNRLLDIEADYYFAAGDLVNWVRGLDAIGRILARRADRMYVLPGNHETEAAVEAMCRRHGLHPFHGRSIEADGYHIAGLGYSSPTPFNTPGEYGEAEMAERLAPFAGLKPLILVCHCPPKGTDLDRMHLGFHAGSHAIASFIGAHQPAYFFCGHIHEAQGRTETLGATRGFNAGKLGYVLELDAAG